MLYTSYFNQVFINLEEPFQSLILLGMFLFSVLLLFSNSIISRIKLHKTIMADIKEKKSKDPDCCILYKGKIY